MSPEEPTHWLQVPFLVLTFFLNHPYFCLFLGLLLNFDEVYGRKICMKLPYYPCGMTPRVPSLPASSVAAASWIDVPFLTLTQLAISPYWTSHFALRCFLHSVFICGPGIRFKQWVFGQAVENLGELGDGKYVLPVMLYLLLWTSSCLAMSQAGVIPW